MKTVFCSVVPPHMLRKLAMDPATDAHTRAAATHTLQLSERLRGNRDILAAIGNFEAAAQTVPPGESRLVYNAMGRETLPGALVWKEGMDESAGDVFVREAVTYADAVFDLFNDHFNRVSLDGRGMRMVSTVHYSRGYGNAFWNGRQMVYGDGDGRIFNRFTKSIDVVGHEFTHGVIQYASGLVYSGQAGAINESLADCFGSMVKQKFLRQSVEQADWLIGAELLMPSVNGKALRDMENPGTAYNDRRLGKDPQPPHMSRYVRTSQDNGGVHINSGIPNRAFCLAAKAIGGNSWEGIGRVWYRAMLTVANPNAQFVDWARRTVYAAGEVFGVGSKQEAAVKDAWNAVGLL